MVAPILVRLHLFLEACQTIVNDETLLDIVLIHHLRNVIRNLTLESGFAFGSDLTRVVGKTLVKVGEVYKSQWLLWVGALTSSLSIIHGFIAFYCSVYFIDENQGYDPATLGGALLEFVVSTTKNLKTISKAKKELEKLQRRDPTPVVEERRGLTGDQVA